MSPLGPLAIETPRASEPLNRISGLKKKSRIIYYIHARFNSLPGAFLTDMSDRVKHQKRNQPAIEKWLFGFVSGV